MKLAAFKFWINLIYRFLIKLINFQIRAHLTPLEIMASLIGAVTHDLDHPGVNQPFLIATSNHLAALYEVIFMYLNKFSSLKNNINLKNNLFEY